MRRLIAPVVVVVLSTTSCSTGPSGEQIEATIEAASKATLAAIPTAAIAPTYTPFPTHTPAPTLTPVIKIATATPSPMPRNFLTLESKGDVVTDNFNWQKCDKAVFTWTAAGRSNMIVHLHKVGVTDLVYLVNEIGPGEGQVLQPLLGGTYYFQVQGPIEGWTLIGECQD